MSDDLISREALIKKIFPYGMPDDGDYPINAKAVMKAILNAPAVDVVEVEHGQWVERKLPIYGTETVCSACGVEAEEITDGGGMLLLSNYCPHCGAKMDK